MLFNFCLCYSILFVFIDCILFCGFLIFCFLFLIQFVCVCVLLVSDFLSFVVCSVFGLLCLFYLILLGLVFLRFTNFTVLYLCLLISYCFCYFVCLIRHQHGTQDLKTILAN